jgi:DnaJ-domain-containing protein 1
MPKRHQSRVNPVKLVGGTYPNEILEQIESAPGFIRMMEESDRAEREGRFVPNEKALRKLRADIEAEPRSRRRQV